MANRTLRGTVNPGGGPAQSTGGAVISVTGRPAQTRLIMESKETRFADAGLSALAGAGTALWSATRPTPGSQAGWALFWLGLGTLAAVEAKGAALKYGGIGMLAGNAAYLALRLAKPNLEAVAPQGPTGYAQVGTVDHRQVFPNGYMA